MYKLKTLISGALMCFSQAVLSANTADIDADIISLRTDCNVDGAAISNCFNNLPDLQTWIWDERAPNAANPLLINIGPGVFYSKTSSSQSEGAFCKNSGHVTFRGAGQDKTIITVPANGTPFSGLSVKNCEALNFESLTLDGADSFYGFYWSGDGSSIYTNVTLKGRGYAWYDNDCSRIGGSEHYFFNSKIISETPSFGGVTSAYVTFCSITWFYGSEIKSIGTNNSYAIKTIHLNGGEVHVYGSSIRAITDSGISADTITAVEAISENSNIHIHGTGIDVITDTNSDITSLTASAGASIHASESSYVLKTNGGTKTRLSNNGGNIQAPYMWYGETPPAITSIHGSDIAITKDSPDGQPHFAIYSDACPDKWFDSTINQCR